MGEGPEIDPMDPWYFISCGVVAEGFFCGCGGYLLILWPAECAVVGFEEALFGSVECGDGALL